MDVSALERKVTKNTKAILPIDLFSHTADNTALKAFADAHGLTFLEDSAEAFGMKWNGAHAGATAKAGVLSFFPTKTLGCFGDGGAILTNDDALAAECRIARVHGAAKKYFHTMVGINSRLDELQAAILNVKLDHVDAEIAERATMVSKYREGLSGLAQVVQPKVPAQASPVWYVFAPVFEKREALAAALAQKGIGTSVYWPKPLHLQECFADLGHRAGDFPVSERLCESTLALPIFVGMSDGEIAYVCDAVKAFYSGR
jgi:dTDP-4-amino-4,6-dideoxygalactose transaminase